MVGPVHGALSRRAKEGLTSCRFTGKKKKLGLSEVFGIKTFFEAYNFAMKIAAQKRKSELPN